jgi:hypothetical protein
VSSAQNPPNVPRFTEGEIYECARLVLAGIRAEIPDYSSVTDPALIQEFTDVCAYNARLCFQLLGDDRFPTAEELRYLEEAARRRMIHGLPLESLFLTYRIARRVHWQYLSERLPSAEESSADESPMWSMTGHSNAPPPPPATTTNVTRSARGLGAPR